MHEVLMHARGRKLRVAALDGFADRTMVPQAFQEMWLRANSESTKRVGSRPYRLNQFGQFLIPASFIQHGMERDGLMRYFFPSLTFQVEFCEV